MKLYNLKYNNNNPRIFSDEKTEKLKKSIQDFPQMMELRPIIVDDSNTVLGGNFRLKALNDLGYDEIPDTWVKKASELTEDQKREFIIKDNIGFGDWDWDLLSSDWDNDELEEWGLDFPEMDRDVNPDDFGEGFNLPDGDKTPFQVMSFTLADEQAEKVKKAIEDITNTEDFQNMESFGNENKNGNALYLIAEICMNAMNK